MSIINNILWSFAEGIESNATSLSDFVIRRMTSLEPKIDWINFNTHAHQLISHLSFVYRNPKIYIKHGGSNTIEDSLAFAIACQGDDTE